MQFLQSSASFVANHRPFGAGQSLNDFRLVRPTDEPGYRAQIHRRAGKRNHRFSEYLLQVPANLIGFTQFSIGQLKIMQEAITPCVFAPFAVFYLGEPLKMDYW